MSIRAMSSNNISSKEENSDNKQSSHLSSYLSLVSQLKSREAIKKPISEYKPSRHGNGAYWRRKCEKCEKMGCDHMIIYDDEDKEYQQYLQAAIKDSLEYYCDQEISKHLCKMVINTPHKPSLQGQYELSRSYQLTTDSGGFISGSKRSNSDLTYQAPTKKSRTQTQTS